MKIVVAGFPETGAELVETALRKVGLNVYGKKENVILLEKEWTKILNYKGTIEDIRQMYQNVDVVADFPACYFWEEVLMAFPDAKVILTKGASEEIWSKDMVDNIKAAANDCEIMMLKMGSPTWWRLQRNVLTPGIRLVLGYTPQAWWSSIKLNECLARKRYRAHNAHVAQNTPKDQLLVYDPCDGWEPLCKFIGINVPNVSFPRGKTKDCDKAEVVAKEKRMKFEAFITLSLMGALLPFGAYKLYANPPAEAAESALSWLKGLFSQVFGK